MALTSLTVLDLLALGWFLAGFVGYAYFTRQGRLARRGSLVTSIQARREQWMMEMAKRDVRIMDAQLLANLSNGNAFFASTSVIVLGGLVAMMGAADQVKARVEELPFAAHAPTGVWELKILLLAVLFVRAFFQFAWAYRLTHYLGIMIGAMPDYTPETARQCENHAHRTAHLAGLSAEHANGGLRSIYFAIAAAGWFFHPLALVLTTAWVTWILYRREYRSRAFAAVDPARQPEESSRAALGAK